MTVVWSISSLWLNQTNQSNQINQINQMNETDAGVPGLANGVLALLIHRLPLIMFDDFLSGIFLPRLLLRGGRIAGGRAAGHGEQEHGKG
jgi:hypothetical protein